MYFYLVLKTTMAGQVLKTHSPATSVWRQ